MRKNLLSTLFIAGSLVINAQIITETVSIGPSGSTDNWYNLEDGSIGTAPSSNWHIAFQVGGLADASIIINSKNDTKLFEYPGDIDDWATVDTTGMTWEPLYNSPTTWQTGAFNQIKNESNQFDYGWGEYTMSVHGVIGSAIYIIIVDGEYKKIKINELGNAGSTYDFTYADLDGNNEVNATANKNDNVGYNFIYYSMTEDEVVDREPGEIEEWDLLFTSYMDLAENPFQEGVYEMQKVTGVLSNPKISIAKVENVDPDTYNDWYGAEYSKNINTIGYDWKIYEMDPITFQGEYVYAEDRVHFIKSNAGNIWKVVFIEYGGGGNGNMVFTKELISTLSIDENEINKAEVIVYPNPASTHVSLILNNMSAQSANINILDMQGKVVFQNEVQGDTNFEIKNISVNHLEAGVYFVNINSGKQSTTQKLVIQ